LLPAEIKIINSAAKLKRMKNACNTQKWVNSWALGLPIFDDSLFDAGYGLWKAGLAFNDYSI